MISLPPSLPPDMTLAAGVHDSPMIPRCLSNGRGKIVALSDAMRRCEIGRAGEARRLTCDVGKWAHPENFPGSQNHIIR
jgi:hypothetical protein